MPYKNLQNIFKDLELENAEDLLIKAELTRKINNKIRNNGTDIKEVTRILELNKNDLLLLLEGKLSHFSIEQLLNYLNLINSNY